MAEINRDRENRAVFLHENMQIPAERKHQLVPAVDYL